MDAGVVTLIGIILTGIFSTGSAIINSRIMHYKSEQKALAAQERLANELEALKQNQTEMSATLNQLKAESVESDERLRKAFISLAKNEIHRSYRESMYTGCIDEGSKESLHSIHESYKENGGNSFAGDEMKDLNRLPVVPFIPPYGRPFFRRRKKWRYYYS